MILNKLYRLKRKKGAVLFVVIAMMTLLVIMATAAYYTARSSHQTVINNYDFSQLYLSAISVSDMVVDAVTNDTVDNTSNRNKFKDLQAAINDKNFSVGKKITAKSSNITDSMTTVEKILSGTASNPVENGVLDAVQVVIQHEDRQKTFENDTMKIYMDYYLFTTTAYYRNNTVTVQDRIGKETVEPSVKVDFTTFFTATGQSAGGGDDPHVDPTRCVVINTKEISDDAFFENTYTIFKESGFNAGSAGNKFLGGMSAAGCVWIEQFNSDIPDYDPSKPETRNDWVIADSLILGGDAQQFNIKQNNLIVHGDLILTKNMNNFYAENIIVMGNVIDLSGGTTSTLNGNLYVDGTIITNLTVSGSDSEYVKAAKEKAKTTIDNMNNQYKSTIATTLGKDVSEISNIVGYGATGGTKTGLSFDGNKYSVFINHPEEMSEENLKDIKDRAKDKKVSSWTEEDLKGKIFLLNRTPNAAKDGYEYALMQTTIEGVTAAVKPADGNPKTYPTYSASEQTMKQTLTIDFSALSQDKDKNGNAITGQYSGTFSVDGASGAADATVKVTNGNGDGNVVVELPYCTDGYVLDLLFDGAPFNHQEITYNIDSGSANSDKLPIVLKANFDDGKGGVKDSRGYNAFSWNIGGYINIENNPKPTNVSVNGDGDVFFEVGNYDSSGNYVPFKLNTGLNTATYYTLENLRIGTDDQLADIPVGNQNASELQDLLKGNGVLKGPDLQSNFDNQIMLISNKTGGVAVNDDRKNTLLCGYLYAPFSNYSNLNSQGEGAPQLGGMIVSNYATQFSNFVYAEPDPILMENLSKALPTIDNADVETTSTWIVNDSSKGLGNNFIG